MTLNFDKSYDDETWDFFYYLYQLKIHNNGH